MGSPYAYTNLLAPAEAKKLYACITKPPAPVAWSDEGGATREVKLRDISRLDLASIVLPNYCSYVDISESDEVILRHKDDVPSTLFLGGDDWFPPEYGEGTWGGMEIVLKDLNCLMGVSFGKLSGRRFSKQEPNSCFSIGIDFPTSDSYRCERLLTRLAYEECPSPGVRSEYLEHLVKLFSVPDSGDPGVFEVGRGDREQCPMFHSHFDPTCQWIFSGLREMIQVLINQSPSDYYAIKTYANVGGGCEFNGERYNVRDIGSDLLARIVRENDFARYNVTYGEVGPCTWSQVSKAKRTVKEPAVTELGVITLEDGTGGDVSLTTYENGYQFFVTFSDLDALLSFTNSEFFKIANWSCDEL